MPTLPSEHNLLFAVLALQNELAKPEDVLAAMQAWVAAKHRSLGDLLVERGALSPEHRRLLDALIEAQLTRHGTANQSLVTLDPSSRVRGVLAPNEIKSERGGPGNVGELENSLEQTVLLASDNTIGPDCLSDDANRLSVGPIGASLGRQQGRACQAMMEDAATSAAPPSRRMPGHRPSLGRRWPNWNGTISSARSNRRATTSARQPIYWAFTASSCCAKSRSTASTPLPVDQDGQTSFPSRRPIRPRRQPYVRTSRVRGKMYFGSSDGAHPLP